MVIVDSCSVKVRVDESGPQRLAKLRMNRECSQVRMVDTISQLGCAECGAGGLVLTDYRPYAFLRALFFQRPSSTRAAVER